MLKPLDAEEAIDVLNTLLVGYEHLELLDKVAQTTYFRQEVKMNIKALNRSLEKAAGTALAEIWGVDDVAMHNILDHKKELLLKICHLKPELQSGLNALVDQYLSMPELTLHRLGIKIVDRDK